MTEEKKQSLKGAEPLELAHAVFDILDAKKARKLMVLHVEEQTSVTEYFVICSGTSSTQVRGLADEVEYQLGLRGVDTLHYEGRGSGGWLALDYGPVIVHVFNREERENFALEELYRDAEVVPFEHIEENEEKTEEKQ